MDEEENNADAQSQQSQHDYICGAFSALLTEHGIGPNSRSVPGKKGSALKTTFSETWNSTFVDAQHPKMHASPQMFTTKGLILFSEFKKYVRNMQFSSSLKQTMQEFYQAELKLEAKKQELAAAQQAGSTLQTLVNDTFVRERDAILGLEARQKLEHGQKDALEQVFADMRKADCDECGLNGHLSCHCWLSSQLNFDLMRVKGDLGAAYLAYKVVKASKEEREGLISSNEFIRELRVEHEN